jgi:hypothetical protein
LQRSSFGMIHLTETETANLTFTLDVANNKPPKDDGVEPLQVELKFLDGDGDVILAPEATPVIPGQSVSLTLLGEDLGPNGGGVRAVVDTLSTNARFLTTLEIADSDSAARFALFRVPPFNAVVWPPPPERHCLGPLTLRSDERAVLTYTNEHPACANCDEPTTNMTLGFFIGVATSPLLEQVFSVEAHESASLELSNFSAPIRACIKPEERSFTVVGAWTFEIFDEEGRRVGIVSDHWPSESGGNGGGGY